MPGEYSTEPNRGKPHATLSGMRISQWLLSGLCGAIGLLGGCGSDDSSDASNGGLSPIVDEATGWKRIKSIAPLGPPANGRGMEIKTLTRVDGTFAFVDVEDHGGVDRYYVKFPADAPADVTTMGLGIGESTDWKNYRYTFRPGTLDVYQSFRENRGSEVYSGLRKTGPITVAQVRSSGGEAFAGLADVYEDGSALLTGADLYGVLFKDGVPILIYGRYSDINEPRSVGYGVELEDHTLAWALLRDSTIAIGTLAQDPTLPNRPEQQQVKGVVSIATPAGYIGSTYLFARAFGNQLVFISGMAFANKTEVSAFRWTEGATTIETLYSNVEIPSTIRLPPALNNAPFLLHLDVNGQLTFFNYEGSAIPSTALMHVDATGPHVVATIRGDGKTVQGPWLIDGAVFAGIGATAHDGIDAQLDLVQLTQ